MTAKLGIQKQIDYQSASTVLNMLCQDLDIAALVGQIALNINSCALCPHLKAEEEKCGNHYATPTEQSKPHKNEMSIVGIIMCHFHRAGTG